MCGNAHDASYDHRSESKVVELGIGGVCWRTYATGALAALLYSTGQLGVQVGPRATDRVFKSNVSYKERRQLANQTIRRLNKGLHNEFTCQLSAVISATIAEPCSDESDIGSAVSLPSPLGLWIYCARGTCLNMAEPSIPEPHAAPIPERPRERHVFGAHPGNIRIARSTHSRVALPELARRSCSHARFHGGFH